MRQFKITQQITQRNPSLNSYLDEVKKQELIDALEEIELAKKIKEGDQKALDKFVKANLRFVISVAKQYQNQWLPLQDLINEGNIWLITAAKKFDESRGFKFISYAVWWIRQSILHALVTTGHTIRTPVNIIWTKSKIKRFNEVFLQENHRSPTISEMAHFLEIQEHEIHKALFAGQKIISLQEKTTNDDNEATREDLLENNVYVTIDDNFEKESLTIDVNRLLTYLSDKSLFYREKKILLLYFWLEGNREHTLEEIGEEFNLTRERVRQLKEKGVRKLRRIAENSNMKQYL